MPLAQPMRVRLGELLVWAAAAGLIAGLAGAVPTWAAHGHDGLLCQLGAGAGDACGNAVDTCGTDGVAGEVEVQRGQADRSGHNARGERRVRRLRRCRHGALPGRRGIMSRPVVLRFLLLSAASVP